MKYWYMLQHGWTLETCQAKKKKKTEEKIKFVYIMKGKMKIYTDRKYQKEKYCQILQLFNLKQVIKRPTKFRKYSQ